MWTLRPTDADGVLRPGGVAVCAAHQPAEYASEAVCAGPLPVVRGRPVDPRTKDALRTRRALADLRTGACAMSRGDDGGLCETHFLAEFPRDHGRQAYHPRLRSPFVGPRGLGGSLLSVV